MKKHAILVTLFLAIACSGQNSHRADPQPIPNIEAGNVLATVNDFKVTQGYVELLTMVNPKLKGQITSPSGKKRLVDNIIEQELMYQQSINAGLDSDPLVIQEMALYKRVIIAKAAVRKEMDKKALDYYEKNKSTEFTKVKIAHIQVNFKKPLAPGEKKTDKSKAPTSAEKKAALDKAKAIQERLKKGEDFAKVAAEMSDDKSTKNRGGELGPVAKDDKRMAHMEFDELVKVAFKLDKDQISNPIETPKGYHIIKILSEVQPVPFEDAKDGIMKNLQETVKNELLKKLKDSAKIEYIDEEIKNAPAQQQPPMMPGQPGQPPTAGPQGQPQIKVNQQPEVPVPVE